MFFGHFFGGEGGVKGCHFFLGGGRLKKRWMGLIVDFICCTLKGDFYILLFYIWEVSQAVFRLLDKSSNAQKTYIYSELLKPPQAISFN